MLKNPWFYVIIAFAAAFSLKVYGHFFQEEPLVFMSPEYCEKHGCKSEFQELWEAH